MRPAHLLIVEDEPEIAELMRYHLTRAGYTVRTADNGWATLAGVRQQRPDLLLLDLMLPDLDGFGICEILRRDPSTATLPVMIVSAWSTADSRNIGLELGALDYLVKPFSPSELVRRVSHLLEPRTDRTAESISPRAG